MKSHIILTSIAASLVSVAGASALEYRPFVGATMGLQGAVYSDSAKDYERAHAVNLPTDFFVFGIDAGVRAGRYNQIYNGGLSITATKSTYSTIEHKYSGKHAADTDLFNIAATYDNYIRISGDKIKRIDLVLGAGLGAMAYHIDEDIGTQWSFAPEFKIGMDFELTHNVTLSANGRAIIPMRSDYAFDMSYIFGGAIKYMF